MYFAINKYSNSRNDHFLTIIMVGYVRWWCNNKLKGWVWRSCSIHGDQTHPITQIHQDVTSLTLDNTCYRTWRENAKVHEVGSRWIKMQTEFKNSVYTALLCIAFLLSVQISRFDAIRQILTHISISWEIRKIATFHRSVYNLLRSPHHELWFWLWLWL